MIDTRRIKYITFAAVSVALAFATSMIKIIDMPMGGSVTLFSMMFICLVGYCCDLKTSLMAGVAYGMLQLLLDPYIVSIPQMLIDYIFAFGALGISGLFKGKSYGLYMGYAVAVLARLFFSVLSGIVFFAQYVPDGMNPFVYSLMYNGAYIGLEAILTIILMCVKPVRKIIYFARTINDLYIPKEM